MRGVVGYSPYASAGPPKAPLLLGGIVALIVAGAAIAGISNSSEPTTSASPSSTLTPTQQMDYELGHLMGEVNLEAYPNVPLVSQQALCRGSYQVDAHAARQLSGVSIVQSDYLAGCYDAVGAS